jgi:hypothetical protein
MENDMAERTKTVNKYIGDLIAVQRHCSEALDRQLSSAFVKQDPGVEEAVRHAQAVLSSQVRELESRLERLEGGGKWKEAVTSVTGFLAGIYGKLRGEALSRALRDDFAALHFVYVCQTMLIATAAACDDAATAELVRGQQRELPPLILKIADCIPAVVVSELEEDGVPVTDRHAAEQAVQAAHDAWHGTSAAAHV